MRGSFSRLTRRLGHGEVAGFLAGRVWWRRAVCLCVLAIASASITTPAKAFVILGETFDKAVPPIPAGTDLPEGTLTSNVDFNSDAAADLRKVRADPRGALTLSGGEKVIIDAVHRISDTQYIVSYQTDVTASTTTYQERDLVRLTTANNGVTWTASMYFPLSNFAPAAGGVNTDALHIVSFNSGTNTGQILVSFSANIAAGVLCVTCPAVTKDDVALLGLNFANMTITSGMIALDLQLGSSVDLDALTVNEFGEILFSTTTTLTDINDRQLQDQDVGRMLEGINTPLLLQNCLVTTCVVSSFEVFLINVGVPENINLTGLFSVPVSEPPMHSIPWVCLA